MRRSALFLLLPLSVGCPWIPPGQHFADKKTPLVAPPSEPTVPKPAPSEPTPGTTPEPPSCTYPVAGEFELRAPSPEPFAPIWLSFGWQMFLDEEGFHDFLWTEDYAFPAFFNAYVYGPEFNYLCEVRFDVYDAVPLSPSQVSAAGLTAAWTIEPAPGSVQTNCPALDPEVYGTDDMAELLSQGSWSFGMGGLGALSDLLSEDQLPYALGGYVSHAGQMSLSSYDLAYQAECGETLLQGEEPVMVAQEASELLLGATHVGFARLVTDASVYSGVSCDRANAGVPDEWNWLNAEPFVPGTTYLGFEFDIVPAPEGGLADYWADTDGDGDLERRPSTVTARFFRKEGDLFSDLCTITFDAQNAVEVDPASFQSETGGELWRAWSLQLSGGSSDCPMLDPAIYGTTDPRELFQNWSFAFGVGELYQNQDIAAGILGLDPATIADSVFGAYFVIDGILSQEQGFGYGYDLDGCLSLDAASAPHPVDVIQRRGLTNLVATVYWVWSID